MRTHSVEEVDEVCDTDEWKNAHIDLSHNALLHGLVVEVWDVRRTSLHVLLDVHMVLK
jgi:hypothetical protein